MNEFNATTSGYSSCDLIQVDVPDMFLIQVDVPDATPMIFSLTRSATTSVKYWTGVASPSSESLLPTLPILKRYADYPTHHYTPWIIIMDLHTPRIIQH